MLTRKQDIKNTELVINSKLESFVDLLLASGTNPLIFSQWYLKFLLPKPNPNKPLSEIP